MAITSCKDHFKFNSWPRALYPLKLPDMDPKNTPSVAVSEGLCTLEKTETSQLN